MDKMRIGMEMEVNELTNNYLICLAVNSVPNGTIMYVIPYVIGSYKNNQIDEYYLF